MSGTLRPSTWIHPKYPTSKNQNRIQNSTNSNKLLLPRPSSTPSLLNMQRTVGYPRHPLGGREAPHVAFPKSSPQAMATPGNRRALRWFMLINIYIYKYSYIYTLIYIYMNVSDFIRTHVDTYQFMHINDNIYIYIIFYSIWKKKHWTYAADCQRLTRMKLYDVWGNLISIKQASNA